MKRAVLTVIGLLLAVSVFGQSRIYIPSGHVNDFANLVDGKTKTDLESKLRDYREKTSIEIAVVTVSSLEGLTVEEFTVNLANKWGVGDKKKDNGVIFLVAPNERKVRIEVGYGLEPDLTDAQSGRIIQGDILPNFRNGKIQEGILVGVGSILTTLGSTPFEARLKERKLAEEKKQAERKRRAEEAAVFMNMFMVVLVFLAIFGSLAFLFYKIYRHRQELKARYLKNAEELNRCANLLDETEREYPKAQERLAELKGDNPKEVWRDLDDSLSKLPESLRIKKLRLESLLKKHSLGNWKKSKEFSEDIAGLLSNVVTSADLLEVIIAKIKEVYDAKDKSPALFKKLADSIEEVKDNLNHFDVSDRTRKKLDEAREGYRKAQSLADNQTVNWLVVYSLVTGAIALVAQAKSSSISDKASAEEGRKPKPKPISTDYPSSRRRSDDDSSSSSWSSWSSSSSSSSGSSDSSFGGFGGGSFGGGGASGSW